MAVATYTSDLTVIFLYESITGVVAWNITGGGGASLGASPDYAVQGTNAVDKQISASEKGFMFDNVTPILAGPHDHFFIWLTLAVYGLAATRDNRGICVCIGDGTSDYVQYHMNGSDTLPFGGALPYAIKFDNTALLNRRTVTGTPGTTPDHHGTTASVTGTAKFSNLGADAARFGTGYTILLGTGADPEADFAGIAADDVSTAEGIFRAVPGGFSLQGKLRVGESGTECELLDLNTNILLAENLEGHVSRDFSEILLSDDLTILTLTNVNFEALGIWNRGRMEMLTPLITAQDETSYDSSPSTEGSFAAGTGYAVADVITLSDGWTTVTVDTLSGSAVATFTVNSTRGRSVADGETLTQESVAPTGGTGFTLTAGADNILGVSDLAFTNVGFIGYGKTIFASTAELSGCRWIGSDQVEARGGDFTGGSTVTGFKDTPLIDAQDETSYDSSPATEGAFAAGTGYSVADVITLSNGATVTVDTLSGSAVATFTVNSDIEFDFAEEGVTLTQVNVAPTGGTGFTLTPEIDNLAEKASMLWAGNVDPSGKLDGMSFEIGPTASHAIEFADDIPSSITLQDVILTGYNASNGEKDSALWFRDTTGTITVNVSGGTTPSYKSDGATISIVADVTLTFTGLKDNSEIRIYTAGTTTELAGIENATAGSPDARTFAAAISGGTSVDYMIHSLDYETIRVEAFSWPTTNQSLPVAQRLDRNFNDPV